MWFLKSNHRRRWIGNICYDSIAEECVLSWWKDAHAGTLRLQCHPDIDLVLSWNLPLRFIWAAIVAEYWITTLLDRWGSLVDRYPWSYDCSWIHDWLAFSSSHNYRPGQANRSEPCCYEYSAMRGQDAGYYWEVISIVDLWGSEILDIL